MSKPRIDNSIRSEFKALARILQAKVPDLTSPDARPKLVAALMEAQLTEAGKRNSSADQQVLQTIHDHAVSLGAECGEPDEDDMTERDIPQSERDKMDPSDFAGEGTSFPIKNQTDVDAAVKSIGLTDQSHSKIRAGIIRIAKRKGLSIPKEWQSEAWKPDGVLLVEGAAFCETPRLQEAATTDYAIKLISPGRGSSGYYGPEVLKKAAEGRIFKAGTQMFWNHDTEAEEGARPEGDLNRLAAVTTTDAQWHENGHDGPGLYARAKVFSDYADKVKEKGPHIGLSIRAGGERDEAARAPDGKPRVITALKNAQSVDFVTRAGRDGKIFTEGATSEFSEGESMTKEEVQALIRESQAPLEEENKRLRKRLAEAEAPALIREALSDINLTEKGKHEVVRRIAEGGIPDDPAKLKELVEKEAGSVSRLLQAFGIGNDIAGFGSRVSEAQMREMSESGEKEHKEAWSKSMEWLAHTFVGKPLRVGTEEAKAARAEAIEAFKEGRAA